MVFISRMTLQLKLLFDARAEMPGAQRHLAVTAKDPAAAQPSTSDTHSP
jgi:hypothetical protein